MPKTSTERSREYRHRCGCSVAVEKKPVKTAAQRSREYRARKKAIRKAAQQNLPAPDFAASIEAPLLKRYLMDCQMKSAQSSDVTDNMDGIVQLVVVIPQPNPPQEVCRTCLDRVPSDTCKSIFSDNVRSIVTMISNVKLMEGDGLPTSICDKCFKQLEAVIQFKSQIESSDATLRMPSIENIKVEQGYVTQEQSIPTDIEQYVQIKEEPVIVDEDVESNYEPASLTALKHEEEDVFSENLDIDISSIKNEYDDPLKLTEKEHEVSVNFASNYINEESEHMKFKKKQTSQNFDTDFTKNNGDGKFEDGKRISEKPNSNYIQGKYDNDTEDHNDSHLVDVLSESKKKISTN